MCTLVLQERLDLSQPYPIYNVLLHNIKQHFLETNSNQSDIRDQKLETKLDKPKLKNIKQFCEGLVNLFGGGVKVESAKAKDKSPKLRKQSDLPVPSTASTLQGNLRPASVSVSGLTAPSPPTPWRKASSPSPVSWLQAGHSYSYYN